MSYDIVQEKVPGFTKRVGDRVLQGSNNSLLVLGTDRATTGPAGVDDGVQGKGAGMAHLVVGRNDPDGNPDLTSDSSYVYLSMKTMADTNLGLTGVEKGDDNKASIIMASDVVRSVFRSTLKISDDGGKNYIYIDKNYLTANVNGFYVKIDSAGVTVQTGNGKVEVQPSKIAATIGQTKVTMDQAAAVIHSPTIKLGGGGEQPWVKLVDAMDKYEEGHNHITAVGPTSPGMAGPASAPLVAALKAAIVAWSQKAIE